jgi:hypothetical protein
VVIEMSKFVHDILKYTAVKENIQSQAGWIPRALILAGVSLAGPNAQSAASGGFGRRRR